uniref:Uncharacterized protein n=1 Tax=Timema bartmani TaxID=61472 RepID=A0A7R9EQF9_9NEOP|nr:unnamed protein product [Timema bartmani]
MIRNAEGPTRDRASNMSCDPMSATTCSTTSSVYPYSTLNGSQKEFRGKPVCRKIMDIMGVLTFFFNDLCIAISTARESPLTLNGPPPDPKPLPLPLYHISPWAVPHPKNTPSSNHKKKSGQAQHPVNAALTVSQLNPQLCMSILEIPGQDAHGQDAVPHLRPQQHDQDTKTSGHVYG